MWFTVDIYFFESREHGVYDLYCVFRLYVSYYVFNSRRR